MVLILMGVSGSGKTTVGQALAADLHWPFFDGDDFHPPANIAKMSQGIPLTDTDRAPWLQAIHQHMSMLGRRGQHAVVACSALKRAYRTQLVGELDAVHLIYLRGSMETIRQRLQARAGHFMPTALLASQFETLEEPDDALTVEISQLPEVIVATIRDALAL